MLNVHRILTHNYQSTFNSESDDNFRELWHILNFTELCQVCLT